MSNCEKVIVYPYDGEFAPILRNRKMLLNYKIIGLVSPRGWGLFGKDAGLADGGSRIGMEVSCDFEESIEKCDTVMFVESQNELDFEKLIFPKIVSCIKHNKNIAVTRRLSNENIEKIDCLLKDSNIKLKNYNTLNKAEFKSVSIEKEIIYDINTPVIFVMGISDMTRKFDIQLALRNTISEKGYRVCQIGSRNYCELMGFHSIPNFMFSTSISEFAKITLFNHYIKKLELEENPDVIIVGIPGGIMPYNSRITNHFGIMAYMMSNAVTPDAAVFSSLYNDYTPQYFEDIARTVKYKFGVEVDCFNLSNYYFNFTVSEETGKANYTIIDNQFLNEKKKSLSTGNIPIYNALDISDMDNMVEYLLNKLAGYGEMGKVL